jgi:hypothetical protein
VREYWVLSSEYKSLTVYLFEGNNAVTRSYSEKDTAPVTVLDGLSIELKPVFSD